MEIIRTSLSFWTGLLCITSLLTFSQARRNSCEYPSGMYTSHGHSYQGPTHKCICHNGSWVQCVKNNKKSSCKYSGVRTKHGNLFEGETLECECNDGHWVNCIEKGPVDIVDLAISAGLSTLVTAVTQAGLVDTLKSEGPFTVFAPSEDAWNALPAGTLEYLLRKENKEVLMNYLLYHVVSGAAVASSDLQDEQKVDVANENILTIALGDGKVMVNQATVIQADVEASNGIVHVIDNVLVPPYDAEKPSIVDTAISAGGFNTLVAAVVASGLADTLKYTGPYTVLAPTDAAFAALGKDTIDTLLENPEKLSQILKYHIISGVIDSAGAIAADGAQVETLNGASVAVSYDGTNLMFNEAKVVMPDVYTGNGIIHAIDTVLV